MPGRVVSIEFLGSTKQLESALTRAGLVAKGSGDEIANAFNSGSTRAGSALERLGKQGERLGVPFAAGLTTAGKHIDDATTKTGRLSAVLGEVGKVSILAGAGIAAGVGAAAVKMGEQYETAQAKIQSSTGVSTKAAKAMTSAFGEVGKFGESSGMETEAAYASVAGQLQATAGHALGTAEAMRVMSAATHLNTAVQGNLAETTGALSSVMQAFHLSTSQASAAADTLYNVSTKTNVPISTLATTADKLHGRLGTLAPSLQDIGSLMIALAGHGVTGSRGVQVVNTALATLVGGSKKTTEVLNDLGVHVYDQQGKFIGLQNVIAQLQPKLAGLSQQQQIFAEKTLFGTGAYQVMGQVIQAGVPAFQRATDAATKQGTAQQGAANQAKTLHGELQTAKAAVDTLGGDLGLILIPKLTAMAKGLAEGITWLTKHKDAALALGVVIAGPLAAAVSVYASQKAASFITKTGEMAMGLYKLGAKVVEVVPTILTKMGLIGSTSQTVAAETGAATAKMEAQNAGLATSAATTAGEVDTAGTEMVAGADATAVGVDTALGATGIGLILVGLGVAAVELEQHWKEVMEALEKATAKAANFIVGQIEDMTLGLVKLGKVKTASEEEKAGTGAGESRQHVSKREEAENYSEGASSTGHNVEGQIMRFWESKGFSPAGAAGFVGNASAESGFNVHEGGGGLYQQSGLGPAGANAVAQQGITGQSEEVLKRLSPSLIAKLKHAKSSTESARLIMSQFEQPEGSKPGEPGYGTAEDGTAHLKRREEAAVKAAGTSNKALQEKREEESGAKPKKGKPKKPAAEPYVEPLESAHQTSLDEGVDYTTKVGAAIKAIGAGVIDKIIPNWYKGQPLVEERLSQGSRKGQDVYYAEGLRAGVREGQTVRAGQAIGTATTQPTGLELGFGGPGGLTLAQASGEHMGEVGARGTKAGQEYEKFIASIGKGGTVLSQVAKAAEAAEKAEAKRVAHLEESGKKLLGEGPQRGNLEQVIQSGTTAQLERVLGVTTTGRFANIPGRAVSAAEAGAAGGKPLTPLTHELAQSAAASGTGKQFDKLVAELKATHNSNLETLASRLEDAHRRALNTLTLEMVATEQTKLAEGLKLQATQLKDQNTLTEHAASTQLNIVKDQSQQQTNAAKAAAQAITDAAQQMSDSMAAAAQAIEDQTKVMADSSNAVVEGIKDRTNIEVSVLGERGLYGLNLIAQKEQVQLDEMKASYDQQIAQAQISEDQLKAQWTGVIAADQQALDITETNAHVAEAQAQAHADSAIITNEQKVAAAQAKLDATVLDQDSKIGTAQLKVLAAATGSQAQQKAAAAGLARAEGGAGVADAAAEGYVKGTEQAAARSNQEAQNQLAATNAYWEGQIAAAQAAVSQAKGESAQQLAAAQQNLQSLEDTAAQNEAAKEKEIAVEKERASTQFAGSGLSVNIYGENLEDPNATASAVGWALRTQIPA